MRLNFLSLLILVVVIGGSVGGAYAAGLVAGRQGLAGSASALPQRAGASSEGTAAATGQGSGGGAGFEAQMGMGGTSGGRGLMGTVEKAEGRSLTITTQEGTTVVTVSDSTSIQRQGRGEMADLQPGARVLVLGDRGADGSYTASSIQILPEASSPTPQERRAPAQRTPSPKP